MKTDHFSASANIWNSVVTLLRQCVEKSSPRLMICFTAELCWIHWAQPPADIWRSPLPIHHTHIWTLTSIWPVDTTSNCSRLFSSNAAFVLLARWNRITSLCRCEHHTLPFTLKALMMENTSLRCGLFSIHAIHLLWFILCNVSSVCKPASGLLVFYFLQTVEMELMQ